MKTKSLKTIMSYDNEEFILRLIRKKEITRSTARERFNRLKEFLYKCAKKEIQRPWSEVLDDTWHEFLLFTVDYRNFCNKYLGKFIDHIPDPENNMKKSSCGHGHCMGCSSCGSHVSVKKKTCSGSCGGRCGGCGI